MIDDEKRLLEFLETVAATDETEIDCEEFLARVSAYVEQAAPHIQPHSEFWTVAQHLRVCTECREEFEALLNVHRSEHD